MLLCVVSRPKSLQLERPQRVSLQRKMGEALYRRGAYQQSAALLQHALAKIGRPLLTSSLKLAIALGYQLLIQAGHRLLPQRLHRRMAAAGLLVAEEQG